MAAPAAAPPAVSVSAVSGDRVGRWATAVTVVLSSTYLWTVVWLVLWTFVPVFLGLQPLVVHSDSMSPGIRTGDVVGIRPYDGAVSSGDAQAHLDVGTVIAFRPGGDGRLTLHRIDAVDEEGYRTKGDANQARDSVVIRPADIDGVAQLLVPSAGWPAHWAGTGHPHLVLAFLVSLPLAWAGQRSPEPVARDELEPVPIAADTD